MDELQDHESALSRLLDQVPCSDQGRAEHRDALRARALGAFDAAGRPRVSPFVWKGIFNYGRELMRRPFPRFVVAAAVCLAVAATWLLLPGQQPTAQAFNMFANALVDARSATFQSEVTIPGQGKQKTQGYYLAPGRMRNEFNGFVSIVDTRVGKIVTLAPQQKKAIVMNMRNLPEEPRDRQFNDVFEQMRDLLAKSRDSKQDDFESLGEKEIDGRRAIGFRLASALSSMTLWGDPVSGLPVLIDVVFSGTPPTEVTMSDFRLNVDLKPELFDTTPPADYKVQAFDVDASKPTEATLIEALRKAADMNAGRFLDNLDTASMQALVIKRTLRDIDKSQDVPPELMQDATTIGRGLGFALQLPDSADVHYAGKGVKRDEPDRPILWYKPPGGTKYRVIYADLTVKDTDRAPDVAGAIRLEKTKPVDQSAPK